MNHGLSSKLPRLDAAVARHLQAQAGGVRGRPWESTGRGHELLELGPLMGARYRTKEGRQRWFTIGRHGAPWTPESARLEARRLLAERHDEASWPALRALALQIDHPEDRKSVV